MQVDSEAQDMNDEAQDKTQFYNDYQPKASQLYAAYMKKTHPTETKQPDVEMVQENKSNEDFLIDNQEQIVNNESIAHESVSKDIDMNQKYDFKKIGEPDIPNESYAINEVSNNSQTLNNTQNIEHMILKKQEDVVQAKTNEDRKSFHDDIDNLKPYHEDDAHRPLESRMPCSRPQVLKSPEYRPTYNKSEPSLTVQLNAEYSNTQSAIEVNQKSAQKEAKLKNLNTIDSSINHNINKNETRDLDQDGGRSEKNQNSVMLDSDSDRSEGDDYDNIELNQISMEPIQHHECQIDESDNDEQKVDLWMKFKSKYHLPQQEEVRNNDLVDNNLDDNDQEDLFGDDWNVELDGTMLGRDDEDLSGL